MVILNINILHITTRRKSIIIVHPKTTNHVYNVQLYLFIFSDIPFLSSKKIKQKKRRWVNDPKKKDQQTKAPTLHARNTINRAQWWCYVVLFCFLADWSELSLHLVYPYDLQSHSHTKSYIHTRTADTKNDSLRGQDCQLGFENDLALRLKSMTVIPVKDAHRYYK